MKSRPQFDMTGATVLHHLPVLKHAGLVFRASASLIIAAAAILGIVPAAYFSLIFRREKANENHKGM